MLRVEYGRKFAKQAERCRRRGKDLGKLKEIVRKLANGESLEKKHHNRYSLRTAGYGSAISSLTGF